MDIGGTWVERAVLIIIGWGTWVTVRIFATMAMAPLLRRIEEQLMHMDQESSKSRSELHEKVNDIAKEVAALNERTKHRGNPW